MLVEFSPGFVVDMKMIRHNFGAPFWLEELIVLKTVNRPNYGT